METKTKKGSMKELRVQSSKVLYCCCVRFERLLSSLLLKQESQSPSRLHFIVKGRILLQDIMNLIQDRGDEKILSLQDIIVVHAFIYDDDET